MTQASMRKGLKLMQERRNEADNVQSVDTFLKSSCEKFIKLNEIIASIEGF